MNERTEEDVIREPLDKNPHALINGRGKVCYCLLSWRIFFEENKNKKHNEMYIMLLESFFKTKDEDRKIEDIWAVELNEYAGSFIISVRIKDCTEYNPTSLWSLITSFKRRQEEGRNWKLEASKSQRQKDSDPDGKWTRHSTHACKLHHYMVITIWSATKITAHKLKGHKLKGLAVISKEILVDERHDLIENKPTILWSPTGSPCLSTLIHT